MSITDELRAGVSAEAVGVASLTNEMQRDLAVLIEEAQEAYANLEAAVDALEITLTGFDVDGFDHDIRATAAELLGEFDQLRNEVGYFGAIDEWDADEFDPDEEDEDEEDPVVDPVAEGVRA
jgi:hypothetical protein